MECHLQRFVAATIIHTLPMRESRASDATFLCLNNAKGDNRMKRP
jgi:hypothetical protein